MKNDAGLEILRDFFQQFILAARKFEIAAIRPFRVVSTIVIEAADVDDNIRGFRRCHGVRNQIGVGSRRGHGVTRSRRPRPAGGL